MVKRFGILAAACLFALGASAYSQAVPVQTAEVQTGGGHGFPSLQTGLQIRYGFYGFGSHGEAQSLAGLVQFGMDAFPANLAPSGIEKANLVLYVRPGGAPGAFTVCQVAQAWTPATVSGANAPACTGTAAPVTITAEQARSGGFLTVDVTPIVQSWYGTANANNFGLLLQPAAPASGARGGVDVQFNAGPPGDAYPPMLNLVLQSQGPQGAVGPQGPIGLTGATGAQGPMGLTGATGAAGPQGPIGLTGATGAQGPAGQGGAIAPVFAAAIVKQISPITSTDLPYVDVLTVVPYPYSLSLLGVQTVSGAAPTSFGEDLSQQACPVDQSTVPGGVACRQMFQLNWPYATCQWNSAQYTLTFGFSSPGLSNETSTITLNSEDWCASIGVTAPPTGPVITSVGPGTVVGGTEFTLTITGLNLDPGGAVAINFGNLLFTPTAEDVTATTVTYVVPGSATQNLSGPVPITVQTGGGVSNQGLVTVLQPN